MYCTDEEILASFQKDMEKGGRLLFNRYYKPLVLFAETMLSGSDLAEDIVQDVFYDFIHDKVFLRVTPEALSTWLFRCVKHACLACDAGSPLHVAFPLCQARLPQPSARPQRNLPGGHVAL